MITLIGVTHEDSKLEEKLPKLLTQEKPDIITVEYDNNFNHIESVRKMNYFILEEIEKLLKGKVKPEYIKEILEFTKRNIENPEYKIIKDFFQDSNIEIHPVDDWSCFCDRDVSPLVVLIKQIIDNNGIDAFRSGNFLSSINKHTEETYEFFKDIYEKNIYDQTHFLEYLAENSVLQFWMDDLVTRDNHMEHKITNLYNPKLKLVHVCGAAHFLDDLQGRTLYSKLKYLNPKRRLANET